MNIRRRTIDQGRTPATFASKVEHERNAPGSPYVELDLNDEASLKRVGSYFIGLTKRHAGWVQHKKDWTPPEMQPGQTEIEQRLLEMLVTDNDGIVNFWDASVDLSTAHGPLSSNFEAACVSFTEALALEVRTQH